ncbi:MAG TPA: serine/threonine-protein kinase [Ktedonosporobacter sp.]|nr:serine/threonine-protein kinase [Ktedonosporobacter sp.]
MLEGQHIDRYRLLQRIGSGGMGEVYLAEDARVEQKVAIKLIRVDTSAEMRDEEETRLFRREITAIARLDHPNILPLYTYGQVTLDGVEFSYLVMPYRKEGTLEHWLRQRPVGMPLSPQDVAQLIGQAADALQHAHDQHIIHQDVKPSNFLIRMRKEQPDRPDLLLADFGIAKFYTATASHSQSVRGTPAYMAPEQWRGRAVPATDQYALAIMAYQLLTANLPFRGRLEQVMHQHLEVVPQPPSAINPQLSSDLDSVLLCALAKEPGQRFGSIRAFATAVRQAITFRGPDAKPSMPLLPSQPTVDASTIKVGSVVIPPPTPAFRPAQTDSGPAGQHGISRRALVLSGGLVGLVTLSGGVAWLALSRRPQSPPRSTGLLAISTSVATPTSAPISLGTTLYVTYRGHHDEVHAVAWSPRGRRIASASADKTVQSWDMINGGNIYKYTGHTALVNAVAWSPDSLRIASASDDFTVQVWNAVSGDHIYTYTAHSGPVNAIAWSPDGTRIVSASFDRSVQVWDGTNGGNIYKYTGHTGSVNAVAWSPDGTRIASASDDSTVQVWNAANGGLIYTHNGGNGSWLGVAWSPDSKHVASAGDGDTTLQVWDAANGGNAYRYTGHTGSVNAVAWSSNGKRIVSASNDSTVQVWDAINGSNAFTYSGHSSFVFAVAWSPDNTRIASASKDQTVQVWQAR